ncbi:TackOD1 domain-containing metal-binding protein [Natronococcus occultus]|uniref:Thaumarchaeal output domain-containing protein n=1 Tax=Natronococcus occultus SP4 TaxID=694430 RepID=L0K3M7_9EURY|nr:hypothetical protein [Natronococcus occultus]AGB39877.1 hypothetical protein Natoc_4172 [Natronococcus occultus SP4]
MVSPGEFRLIDALLEDGAFEPDVDEDGSVSYDAVAQLLDDPDDEPSAVLEQFATRGVLNDEFVSKVYVCPDCATEGLQYTTVCPACGDPRAVETAVIEHVCGHTGPESEFESEDGYRCPDCEQDLESVDIEKKHRYSCRACPESFDVPDDRLRCRECESLFPPLETIERVLYRYSLTDEGEAWLEHQRAARETAAAVLEERRFETEIDTVVDEGSRPVHVLAEDRLMGDRRIVAISETPEAETVDAFAAFAESVDAHPVVVTTSGTVQREVAERAERSELTVLAFDESGEGSLVPEYETTDSVGGHRTGLFQRLTAALEVPSRGSRQ